MEALQSPVGQDEGWVVAEVRSLGHSKSVLCLVSFSLLISDAPSRDPTSFSSNGAPPSESETTSHSPHATWHTAPNASTNGGTTTTYTGNCFSTGVFSGKEMRVGGWALGTGEGRGLMLVCLLSE